MKYPLIILVAGIGSRMKSSNTFQSGHKAMLTFREIPLLDYQLYLAYQAGIRDIIIVVGEDNFAFRKRYGFLTSGNPYHGLSISYAIQKIPDGHSKPLGTADALLQALKSQKYFPESIIVCNGDNLYSVAALTALCELDNSGGWIAYDADGLEFDDEHLGKFGLTETDDHGYLKRIFEKPGTEEIRRRRTSVSLSVTMNIWKLPVPTIIPYLELCPIHPIRNEMELPRAIMNMVEEFQHSMRAVKMKTHVPDLTSMQDMDAVQQYIANNFPEKLWS